MTVERFNSAGFIVIIDTDQYPGGFERQMCAFVTGQVGDCGVGKDDALMAKNDAPKNYIEWCEDSIDHVADENGTFRPVSIGVTPGYWNDGMGSHWPDSIAVDNPKVIKVHKNKINEYYRSTYYEEHDPTRVQKELDSLKENGVQKYPAYQSVEMFFYKNPPDWVRDIMRKRLAEFIKGRKFNVLNVRFIKRSINTNDIDA